MSVSPPEPASKPPPRPCTTNRTPWLTGWRLGVPVRSRWCHRYQPAIFLTRLSLPCNPALPRPLRQHGYFAISVVLPAGDDELPELQRFLAARIVDGFILARTRVDDSRVSLLAKRGVPFITHGRTQMGTAHAWVDTDNEEAVFLLADRLVGLGHTRLAFLNAPLEMNFAALREQGFLRALKAHGLDLAQCPVCHGELSAESGEQLATRLIAGDMPVTAIVCATDAIALGAMSAVRRAGLVVGRDVSVVGYGNTESGRYADPPLTSIDHAIIDNGKHLADLLMRQMNGEDAETLNRLETGPLDGPPVLTGRACRLEQFYFSPGDKP